MEINEFIDKFAEIFDDIDASALAADTKFRELDEWSSLTALSTIAFTDEEYDVELKGDDIRKAETILDLFNIVKSKV
jgi:acyl carrier protein